MLGRSEALGTWRWVMGMAAVTAGLLAACGGAPRGSDGRTIVVAGKGYRVAPPPGWQVVASRADVALRQPDLQAGLMAHATCEGRTPRRSLPILVRHLRFGLRDVRDLDEAPVEIAGRPALRSRFTARLDGVPVAVGAVTLESGRCVYDLVVVAPPERLVEAAEAFERFAASFELTDPGGAR
jgi:hypothetical protein